MTNSLKTVGIIATMDGNEHLGTSMATVEKISIALPPEMIATVKSAVESGEYSSASEVIREALRSWKFKRKVDLLELEELRSLAKEGIDSGPSIDAELVFAKLKARYASKGNE